MKNKFKIGQVVYSPEHGFCKVVHRFKDSSSCTIRTRQGEELFVAENPDDFDISSGPKVYPLTPMQAFAIERLIPAGELDVIELGEFWAMENSISPTSRNEVGYRLAAARCFKSLQALGIVKSVLDGEDYPYYELAKPEK